MDNVNNEMMLQNFKRWVNSNTNKSFDLNAEKEDVRQEFLYKYLNQEFGSIDELVVAVAKSYLSSNVEKVMPYIDDDKMGMGIDGKAAFLNRFLEDYIVDEQLECRTNKDFYEKIAQVLTDTLEDACGNVIWTEDLLPTGKELFRKTLMESLKSKGYVQFKKDPKIFVKMDVSEKETADFRHQAYLLRTYQKLVKEYAGKFDHYTLRKSDEKDFYDFWNIVEYVISSYESRMRDSVKKTPEFLAAKAVADKFFAPENLEKIRKAHTKFGRRGNYCEALYDTIHNFKNGIQTEEDVATMKEFYKKIEKLGRALKVEDENGKNFPTNYFVCLPEIHPANILDILSNIERHKILDEEKIKTVSEAKRLIRTSFANASIRNNGDTCDLRHVLHSHRIKVQRGDFVIDNTTEEGYNYFVQKIDKIIKDNNLPASDICASTIAKDLMAGRENPIKMPQENEKVDTISK